MGAQLDLIVMNKQIAFHTLDGPTQSRRLQKTNLNKANSFLKLLICARKTGLTPKFNDVRKLFDNDAMLQLILSDLLKNICQISILKLLKNILYSIMTRIQVSTVLRTHNSLILFVTPSSFLSFLSIYIFPYKLIFKWGLNYSTVFPSLGRITELIIEVKLSSQRPSVIDKIIYMDQAFQVFYQDFLSYAFFFYALLPSFLLFFYPVFDQNLQTYEGFQVFHYLFFQKMFPQCDQLQQKIATVQVLHYRSENKQRITTPSSSVIVGIFSSQVSLKLSEISKIMTLSTVIKKREKINFKKQIITDTLNIFYYKLSDEQYFLF